MAVSHRSPRPCALVAIVVVSAICWGTVADLNAGDHEIVADIGSTRCLQTLRAKSAACAATSGPEWNAGACAGRLVFSALAAGGGEENDNQRQDSSSGADNTNMAIVAENFRRLADGGALMASIHDVESDLCHVASRFWWFKTSCCGVIVSPQQAARFEGFSFDDLQDCNDLPVCTPRLTGLGVTTAVGALFVLALLAAAYTRRLPCQRGGARARAAIGAGEASGVVGTRGSGATSGVADSFAGALPGWLPTSSAVSAVELSAHVPIASGDLHAAVNDAQETRPPIATRHEYCKRSTL